MIVTLENERIECPEGTKLCDLAKKYEKNYEYPIIVAKVNGVIQEFYHSVLPDSQIEFCTTAENEGKRAYIRGISMLLLKCLHEEIPEEKIEQIEENMNNKTVTITGNVVSYGNTPFAYPGIRMEDGKTYTIQADSPVKKKLLSLQGRKIEFKGKIITQEENVLQRETFLLESYRLLD